MCKKEILVLFKFYGESDKKKFDDWMKKYPLHGSTKRTGSFANW